MASTSGLADSSFLRRAFSIVDATACFLSKRRMLCTPERIVAMAGPSCPGLLAHHIVEMAQIAPGVVSLRTTDGGEADGVTTHVSLLPAGETLKASTKRRLLFEQACDAADAGDESRDEGACKRRRSKSPELDKEGGKATGVLHHSAAPTAAKTAADDDDDSPRAPRPPVVPVDWAGLEAHLASLPFFKGQIAYSTVVPARSPRHAPLTRAAQVPTPLWSALSKHGIRELFTHQARAIDAALSGAHVLVCTGTSSGKSLAFYVPVLSALLADASRVCLFVFPTKALAQDQLRALNALIALEPDLAACVHPAVFDGDTPFADRGAARESANVLFTNPDTIHATLLPGHRAYARVFECLHTVVLDECHTYRGVFGGHVAQILRRLARVAERYGSRPRFIGATATIGNPMQHFRALVPLHCGAAAPGGGSAATALEAPLVLIGPDDEGCAAGRRRFILWDPPLVFPAPASPSAASSARRGSREEADGEAACQRQGSGGRARGGQNRARVGARRRRGGSAIQQLDRAAVADEDGPSSATGRGRVGPSLSAQEARPSSSYADAPRPAGDAAVDGSCLRVRTDWRAVVAGLVGADVMRALWGEGGARAALRAEAAREGASGEREDPPAAAAAPAPPAWLPRWVASRESSGPRRRSAFVEASVLLAALVRAGCRTLAFARSRGGAELLLQLTHEQLGSAALCAKVQSYRAGYVREQRRRIERALFAGDLLAVVATNALELGVDIGCLDVTLLLGCPASAASGAQQAGRAGRGGRDSTCIVVATDSPIVRERVGATRLSLCKPPPRPLPHRRRTASTSGAPSRSSAAPPSQRCSAWRTRACSAPMRSARRPSCPSRRRTSMCLGTPSVTLCSVCVRRER